MNSIDTVVSAFVEGVRGALEKHDVTFDECRAAVKYLLGVADAGEIPLLTDLFFNTTMGRHSWRPAHVHYKARKYGDELTKGEVHENGVRVVEFNFDLVPTSKQPIAA